MGAVVEVAASIVGAFVVMVADVVGCVVASVVVIVGAWCWGRGGASCLKT